MQKPMQTYESSVKIIFNLYIVFHSQEVHSLLFIKEGKNNLHLNIYHNTNLEAENSGEASLKSVVLLAFSLWWRS